MTLINCLSCRSPDQSTVSDFHIKLEKHDRGQHYKAPTTRNWSGPLMSFPMDNTCMRSYTIKLGGRKGGGGGGGGGKRHHHHRRRPNIEEKEEEEEELGEPKLVRSRGVRRDWSFENLSDDQPHVKRSKTVAH